jgi:RimJ/RimL family protein N-acetyltransferase
VTLRTLRLLLAPAERSHLEALHRIWNEPGVRRYLWDDRPVSWEQAEGALSPGLWTVLDKDSGEVLGCCGLRPIPGADETEILFALTTAVWGRGLATEAAAAVIRHAFDTLGLARVVGRANPLNPASCRVLEKLGFVFEQQIREKHEDLRCYSLTRG